MLKNAILRALPFVCVAAVAITAAAEPIRVALDVTAESANSSEVKSFLSRELRKLGDVVIADGEVNHRISIVAIILKDKNGKQTGHVMSFVVTAPLREDGRSRVLKYAAIGEVHGLQTHADLAPLCAAVVTAIDAEVFESDRRADSAQPKPTATASPNQ